VIGFALRPLKLSTKTIVLIGFPGEILLNLLKLLILPLIVSSLISGKLFGILQNLHKLQYLINLIFAKFTNMTIILGLAQMNPKQSGRIGLLAICYYMATTLIAVIVITILF
jgi:Na+/H+-dicarboxylate symporter